MTTQCWADNTTTHLCVQRIRKQQHNDVDGVQQDTIVHMVQQTVVSTTYQNNRVIQQINWIFRPDTNVPKIR